MKKILKFLFFLICFGGSFSTGLSKTTRIDFDEYLTHITCFIHFTKNLYPSYLEFKEKTPYGLERAERWASGRLNPWWHKNDPNTIWVSERFAEMGYRLVGGLPFDHETACPFEVGIIHQNFPGHLVMISEWVLDDKKYEYWAFFTGSKLGRGVVFVLMRGNSLYEERDIIFLDTQFKASFQLKDGDILNVNESDFELFKRMGQANYSKSFKGSIWEKMTPLYEYDRKTKTSGDDLRLVKIPWKWKRYKELFTEERRRILANYLDKQDLLPSEENAVIATTDS